VITNVPLLNTALVGVKVTLIMQVAAGANVAAQVPPCTPVGLTNGAPLVAILEIFNTPFPVLVNVAVFGALVVLTGVSRNVSPTGGTGETILATGINSLFTVTASELAVTLA
jgi:hypothetical protein